MKAALLCNGPSRLDFKSRLGYDYVIGCNIPWTKVDSTVIFDVNVLNKMDIPQRFYCSRTAWRELSNRERFIGYLIELYEPMRDYDTAGHAAARILLKLGAKEIDIYGCDSWWNDNTDSYTHQFVDSRAIDMNRHVKSWRQRWNDLMGANPEVTFKFIGENK